MSRIRHNIACRHLRELLGTAEDDAFFALCWATHAFQNGRAEAALKYYRFPPQAMGDVFKCEWPIYPWSLETLLNELLIAPKRPLTWPPLTNGFEGIRRVFNALSDVENSAYALLPEPAKGIPSLGRVVQRQFEWQRADVSLQQLFRAHFLYGGEFYTENFALKYGLTLSEFTFSCFALFLVAQQNPFFDVPQSLPRLGLEREAMAKVLELISMPRDSARAAAAAERAVPEEDPSYRPSILRRHPCIRFGDRFSAPLPALVIRRSTSGLFYDLAGADGRIRNEVAAKFETYCAQLLASMLTSMQALSEFSYRFSGRNWASPDVLLVENRCSVRVIVECKATRMPVPARFAAQPQLDDARGYSELARGITQIWRFASHCRREGAGNLRRHDEIAGLLVTLDSWLTMAGGVADEVPAVAHRLADEDVSIEPVDRIQVLFVSIEDLELLLAMSTDQQFFETLAAASKADFRHWILPNVRAKVAPALKKQRTYGLKRSIAEVVPWWRSIDRRHRE